MKNLTRIWRYLADYKGSLSLYFLCSILAAACAVLSIGLLIPILNVLFFSEAASPGKSATLNDQLLTAAQQLAHTSDKLSILGIICIIVVVFTVLKNLFSFLAISILLPVRHAIVPAQ